MLIVPERNIPEGVSFQKSSLVLPGPSLPERPGSAYFSTHTGIKGEGSFQTALLVWVIEVPSNGKATATINGGNYIKWPKVQIKTGEYLQIGDVGHEVLAIVPQDKQRNIFGWVELAGEPIPVTKLVEKKAIVVNPKPKE